MAVTFTVVKEGVDDTAIVDVPDKLMLLPAVSKLAISLNNGAEVPADLKT